MLYFDTSAIVSFFIADEHTELLRNFLKNVTLLSGSSSLITPLEFDSAIQRRLNSKEISPDVAEQAKSSFLKFRKRIHLLAFDENSLKIASHVQKLYGLRPGDSIQLSAALACRDNPSKVTFLSFDEKLNNAAENEGFNLIDSQ